jgi:hypothetical protein
MFTPDFLELVRRVEEEVGILLSARAAQALQKQSFGL